MQSASRRWGNARIMVGTILGGILGFYAMHRAELSYKRMWDERLKKYVEEKQLREEKARQEVDFSVGESESGIENTLHSS